MELTGLRLKLAKTNLIKKWASHKLPNGKKIDGKISNPKTVNYQTFKPEKGGIFCERIFGPVKEFTCACGRAPVKGQKFCSTCEVEYISTFVRRYRLGYIQICTAVAHTWFFKGSPNFFSLFLNLPKNKIDNILYCVENISRDIFTQSDKNFKFNQIKFKFVLPLRKLNIFKKNNFTSNKHIFWFKKKLPKNYQLLKNRFNFIFFYKNLQLFISINFNYFILNNTENKKLKINFIYIKFLKTNIIKTLKNHNYIISDFRFCIYIGILRYKDFWRKGGLRDSTIYFGSSVISKMFSWLVADDWFFFSFFMFKLPQKNDYLNKFYPGPPGIINFWGSDSRLFCFSGSQIMKTWLAQLIRNNCNDGRLLEIQIRLDLAKLNIYSISENELTNKIQLLRRFKYLRLFRFTKLDLPCMILNAIPVLPPSLRPMLQLNNNKMVTSDLNKLYQTVIFRNNRLYKLTKDKNFNCLNSEALRYAQRLLQESVDILIENNDKSNKVKSLSDLFKGKKGRFRQNLLGKRVDYSGRSVIVVGPYLKIYECGLPIEIAFELFQPFLIRLILLKNEAQTILGAKKLFKQNPKLALNFLKQIVSFHPILLNRAPTLHRLGIQAFKPCLIEGKAILLHPLVCSAFNADFDGDQMGVHIPLCFESRAESWKITWSQNNLFSIATGLPVCIPSQDMILGSCFLTTRSTQKYSFNLLKNYNISWNKIKFILFKKPKFLKINSKIKSPISFNCKSAILSDINYIYFSNLYRKENDNINLNNQESIWLSYNSFLNNFETEDKTQKIIEIRLNLHGGFYKFRSQFNQQFHFNGFEIMRKFRTTFGRAKFYENIL